MNNEELQEARTNPEFLQFLDEKEQLAIANEDLEALYEVLDNLLILDLDEQRISKIYETILHIAFSGMEDRLLDERKLSLLNEDFYLIRAFYEHAVEKWSQDNFEGSKQLFFILSQIIEDRKLVRAMKIHLIACANLIDIDNFNEEFVSKTQMETDEVYGYFIMNFKFDTKEYINKNKELLGDLLDELGHLLG